MYGGKHGTECLRYGSKGNYGYSFPTTHSDSATSAIAYPARSRRRAALKNDEAIRLALHASLTAGRAVRVGKFELAESVSENSSLPSPCRCIQPFNAVKVSGKWTFGSISVGKRSVRQISASKIEHQITMSGELEKDPRTKGIWCGRRGNRRNKPPTSEIRGLGERKQNEGCRSSNTGISATKQGTGGLTAAPELSVGTFLMNPDIFGDQLVQNSFSPDFMPRFPSLEDPSEDRRKAILNSERVGIRKWVSTRAKLHRLKTPHIAQEPQQEPSDHHPYPVTF
ncbi:hypothetical protein C8F04DRAFT_1191661 [Mycena alexandri]|uniref:Uncharacterized protein n=1 Tax=Mycena alexandri TaxID=1745969 RepID=A0AAD6SFP9_9AGAR|nr:hypothetical protein C8F04DRAFT_1191661 [Mycena alexandri]